VTSSEDVQIKVEKAVMEEIVDAFTESKNDDTKQREEDVVDPIVVAAPVDDQEEVPEG
jgi:hypothetical protein